jgi:hypothetical protein
MRSKHITEHWGSRTSAGHQQTAAEAYIDFLAGLLAEELVRKLTERSSPRDASPESKNKSGENGP